MIKNILIITLGIATLLISNYLGHVNPPFSISFTPVLIGLFTGMVLFFTDFRLSIKFGLITGLIILNDVLIRLYAGGTHDFEGLGWIAGFLFIGLIISLIEIIIYGLIKQRNKKVKYFLYVIGSCVILYAYLSYFSSIGMVYINNPTEQIGLSKDKGLFISEVSFSDNSIIIGNDTVTLKYGWIEKQTRLNHSGLLKRTETTDQINCVINLEGKFDKYGYNDSLYYKVNESDVNGANPVSKIITFSIGKSTNVISLYFFKQGEWTKFKEIKIKTATNTAYSACRPLIDK